jgi:hypothetical protein
VRGHRGDSSCEAPSFKSPELALMTHGTDVSAFEVSVGGHAQRAPLSEDPWGTPRLPVSTQSTPWQPTGTPRVPQWYH